MPLRSGISKWAPYDRHSKWSRAPTWRDPKSAYQLSAPPTPGARSVRGIWTSTLPSDVTTCAVTDEECAPLPLRVLRTLFRPGKRRPQAAAPLVLLVLVDTVAIVLPTNQAVSAPRSRDTTVRITARKHSRIGDLVGLGLMARACSSCADTSICTTTRSCAWIRRGAMQGALSPRWARRARRAGRQGTARLAGGAAHGRARRPRGHHRSGRRARPRRTSLRHTPY